MSRQDMRIINPEMLINCSNCAKGGVAIKFKSLKCPSCICGQYFYQQHTEGNRFRLWTIEDEIGIRTYNVCRPSKTLEVTDEI